MKKLLLALITLFALNICNAQNKVGSVAPDVTFTDLNGTSHNLYSYLDSGITVIFDLFATWCMPCRNFRNSHVFDSLDLHYGMKGNILPGKIKVFSIECDPGTNRNGLIKYAEGAKYTYIEADNISSDYPAPYIPQFYVICPNRLIAYDSAGVFPDLYKESFWVSYLENCPEQITNLHEFKVVNNIKVYPNPASDFLNLQMELPHIQKFSYRLISCTGKTVLYKEITPPTTLISENLHINNLKPGIYILQIHTNDKTSSIKVSLAPQ